MGVYVANRRGRTVPGPLFFQIGPTTTMAIATIRPSRVSRSLSPVRLLGIPRVNVKGEQRPNEAAGIATSPDYLIKPFAC